MVDKWHFIISVVGGCAPWSVSADRRYTLRLRIYKTSTSTSTRTVCTYFFTVTPGGSRQPIMLLLELVAHHAPASPPSLPVFSVMFGVTLRTENDPLSPPPPPPPPSSPFPGGRWCGHLACTALQSQRRRFACSFHTNCTTLHPGMKFMTTMHELVPLTHFENVLLWSCLPQRHAQARAISLSFPPPPPPPPVPPRPLLP